MVQNVLINLLDHDFEGLVTITPTKAMEVEVEEFDFGFLRVLIDLPDELRCDSYLSWRVVPQQVNYLNRSV